MSLAGWVAGNTCDATWHVRHVCELRCTVTSIYCRHKWVMHWVQTSGRLWQLVNVIILVIGSLHQSLLSSSLSDTLTITTTTHERVSDTTYHSVCWQKRSVGECFFWYRLTRAVPDKIHRALKRLCVCVCKRGGHTNPQKLRIWSKLWYFGM